MDWILIWIAILLSFKLFNTLTTPKIMSMKVSGTSEKVGYLSSTLAKNVYDIKEEPSQKRTVSKKIRRKEKTALKKNHG